MTIRPAVDRHLIAGTRTRAMRGRLRRHWATLPSAAARRDLAALVRDPIREVQTWPVEAALRALPWVGPAKIRRALAIADVPEGTPLGRLKVRQRLALAAWLEDG